MSQETRLSHLSSLEVEVIQHFLQVEVLDSRRLESLPESHWRPGFHPKIVVLLDLQMGKGYRLKRQMGIQDYHPIPGFHP